MSADVNQFVVHQIILSEEGKLVFVPRSECFNVSKAISDLAAQLHSSFNAKPSKGVGGFGSELDASVADLLRQWQSQDLSFYDFSLRASERLLKAITDEAMVETGYVVFSHYQYLATDYLMIAMLDTKESMSVNSSLDIAQNEYLDIPKMQLAVRIDLTQLEVNEDSFRYISFIKGRMGRKISDFFMNFMGLEEQVDVKQQNKQFVQQLDSYLASQMLDADEKHQQRKTVADYYKDKAELGEDIHIKEIDGVLPSSSEQGQSFSVFNQNMPAPLEESFQADKSMLNAMNKFSGAGGGVTLSFARNLLGQKVKIDLANDTITIEGIPPNLRDQLSRTQSGSDE